VRRDQEGAGPPSQVFLQPLERIEVQVVAERTR
jgi:hypothetical protein